MRVTDLIEALRNAGPDAEVVVCLEVPDGLGDYLLLGESTASFAEPCPGDDGRFLALSAMTLANLASQSAGPSLLRELAKALERGQIRWMENGEWRMENASTTRGMMACGDGLRSNFSTAVPDG